MAKKQKNGQLTAKQLTAKRKKTNAARERVLEAAREQGVITNTEARKIGRWAQCWYHLQAMCEQGLLKHTAYNTWEPTGRNPKFERHMTVARKVMKQNHNALRELAKR